MKTNFSPCGLGLLAFVLLANAVDNHTEETSSLDYTWSNRRVKLSSCTWADQRGTLSGFTWSNLASDLTEEGQRHVSF